MEVDVVVVGVVVGMHNSQRHDVVIVRVAGAVVGIAVEQPLVHVHGERHRETTARHVSAGVCYNLNELERNVTI